MRNPAVADRFYPGGATELSKTITELFPGPDSDRAVTAHALIAPHAGYIYSGELAAKTFAAAEIPETVILLGPNHHGQGAAISLSTETWNMPFGPVETDIKTAEKLLQHSSQIKVDESAHLYEHSLEVQLPFLQMLQKKLRIVPLTLSRLSYPLCEELGTAIAKTIQESSNNILMVVSSDMSHYEPRKVATEKDRAALQCIEDLDPYGLYSTVFEKQISMCGVIPTVTALIASKLCGASQSKLIGYTDSGYISGDTQQVVGYAGVIIC